MLMPAPQERRQRSIVAKMAAHYGMEAEALEATLRETIFPTGKNSKPATKAQVAALMLVADQYGLNPFTREVWAFPSKEGGIVPAVSIDGWLKLMNAHPQMDGIELDYEYDEGGALVAALCTIWRKDRARPFTKRETYAENYNKSKYGDGPWDKRPERMLGHRAMIQAIRVVFSFSGIYEPEEAEAIADAPRAAEYQVVERPAQVEAAVSQLEAALTEPSPSAAIIDPETGEVVEFGEQREPGCDDEPWPSVEGGA